MRIADLFHSIQGEGKLMGVPSTFIRASGCNLRCVWCDTPYASWNPEGEDVRVDEIVKRVETFGAPNHHWLQVTVEVDEPQVFTFRQRIVAANVIKR